MPSRCLPAASVTSKMMLLCVGALFSFMLFPGGLEAPPIAMEGRITWQDSALGDSLGGDLSLSKRSPRPALRGCCGAPAAFLWVFLDGAQEAEAGKPFRTKVLARDAHGRPARPADCETLRVDLGLTGRARLSSATATPVWRKAELELIIENEMAETVEAEMKIASPDPEGVVLLQTSRIKFASGPAHRLVVDLRRSSSAREGAAARGQQSEAKVFPAGEWLEVAVSILDRFDNRVALAAAGLGGLALRGSGSVEFLPATGHLRVEPGGEVGIASLRGAAPGSAEIWLEANKMNATTQLGRDLGALTSRTLSFAAAEFGAAATAPAKPPPPSPRDALSEEDARWADQAEKVREAFLHAWRGYRRYAWGRDELMPVSMSGKDTFGGVGATVVDSLTTLWLMGLEEEFEQAAAFVRDELDFDRADSLVSVFELVIRGVGGLLGAHTLSGRKIFLDRARELAERLLPAFNTKSRLPWPRWNIARGGGGTPSGEPTILSEAGSVQLEFRALSDQTGDPKFREAGDAAFAAIRSTGVSGLMPVYLTPPDHAQVKALAAKFAFGALTDSYYEYLLKQWVQHPAETNFKDLWISVVDELPGLLKPRPTPSSARRGSAAPPYKIVEVSASGEIIWKMDHLSCYAPAMFALGLNELPKEDLEGGRGDILRSLAEGVTDSCVQMWTSSRTGLAPEFMTVRSAAPHEWQDVPRQGRHSFLRPETAESLFYLYRTTGDEKYRRWGQRLLDAILTHAKVPAGFCSVQDVNQVPTEKVDELQSFVLAETFKYLYLLFSPKDRLDMDRFVLNTEGHPLPRPPRVSS